MTKDDGQAIVHIVFWRLNGVTPELRTEQAAAIRERFASSRDQFSGLMHLQVGHNVTQSRDGWDVAAYMVFANEGALHAYMTSPAHDELKALIGPMRSERAQIDFTFGD